MQVLLFLKKYLKSVLPPGFWGFSLWWGVKSWVRDRVLKPPCVYAMERVLMPSRFRVTARDDRSMRFLQGWYDMDHEQGVVWSKREGYVVVSKPYHGKEIYLEAILPPAFDGGVNRLQVSCNGIDLGVILNETQSFDNFNATFNISDIRERELILKFTVSHTFQPHGSGEESDARKLGFAFGQLQVRGDRWSYHDVILTDYLRLSLLRVVIRLSDRLCAKRLKRGGSMDPGHRQHIPWLSGISVVVYACTDLHMVEKCLESVIAAGGCVDEPMDVVVVLNGPTQPECESLRDRFPHIRCIRNSGRFDIASDIRNGVDSAVHDWVYLLHAGMALKPDALFEVLRWRAPHVFSVGSSLLQSGYDGSAYHETARHPSRIIQDRLVVLDSPSEDHGMVRSSIYTDGCSALFHRGLLQRLLPKENCYSVSDWIFIESGVRAWKSGYEVLLCPASTVQCHSVESMVPPPPAHAEPGLVDFRDLVQFELRNSSCYRILSQSAMAEFRCIGLQNRRAMVGPGYLISTFRARREMHTAPFKDLSFRFILRKYYPTPFAGVQSLPCIIFVSPYVLFPPTHGGAVRMYRIIEELCKVFRLVVLSDEEAAYNHTAFNYFSPLYAVHLVGGRPPEKDESSRIDRIHCHSHNAMRHELKRIIASYRPQIVQLEFVELAGMVEDKGDDDAPWVMALHDVLLSEKAGEWTDEDRYEKSLIDRFSAVIACSDEDAVLLDRDEVHVVPNGTQPAGNSYVSSKGRSSIMFMGPFRYRPNLEGVRIFLQNVFPALLDKFPCLEIHLLCGSDARRFTSGMDCFDDPHVHFVDYVENVRPWLDRCALTINPLYNIRGTSIKLLESVAAGRICVTTIDGARGYGDMNFPSLVKTRRIEDFLPVLERLLSDEEYRLALEKVSYEELHKYSWSRCGQRQADIYRKLMKESISR